MTDLPAPIVGTAGPKTSEFIVAVVTLALIVAGAIFHKDLSGDVTVVSAAAGAVVSLGYGLSRAITKNGVVQALASQHAALSAAGTEIIRTVETVDPEVTPRVDGLEAKLTGLESAVQGLSTAAQSASAVDPTVEARLKAIEAKFTPLA